VPQGGGRAGVVELRRRPEFIARFPFRKSIGATMEKTESRAGQLA
jgi:hypothetical protein